MQAVELSGQLGARAIVNVIRDRQDEPTNHRPMPATQSFIVFRSGMDKSVRGSAKDNQQPQYENAHQLRRTRNDVF
jgi:hypothetical protein